jgi:hypothetical protein
VSVGRAALESAPEDMEATIGFGWQRC